MKKTLSVLICIILLSSMFIFSVSAAGSVVLTGGETVKAGEKTEITVLIKDCPQGTAASIKVELDDGLSVVSGSALKKGSISTFDKKTNKGAIGGIIDSDANGDFFKLVLAVDSSAKDSQNLKITVTAKNGSKEVFNQTAEKAILLASGNTSGNASESKKQTQSEISSEIKTEEKSGEVSAAESIAADSEPKDENKDKTDEKSPYLIYGVILGLLAVAVLVYIIFKTKNGKNKQSNDKNTDM